MIDLQLYSFNVRGLRDSLKRNIIFKHLQRKSDCAVFLLQETHSLEADEDLWRQLWSGKMYFSHGRSDSCGVLIMFSPGLNFDIKNIIKDDNGRFLAIHFDIWENEDILLGNVYAPTRNKVQEQIVFLESIKGMIAELDFIHLILGGDFNTVFDPKLDKMGGDMVNCTNNYTSELKAFMETYNLADAIRLCHPDRRIYTRTQRKPAVLSRIDHWLISSQLCNCMYTADVFPGLKSDHSIIYLNLGKGDSKRGRFFWKFNSQLLRDPEFVSGMKVLLNALKLETQNMPDKGFRWDYIQTELRGFCLKHSFKMNKDKKAFKSNVEKELKNIEIELEASFSEELVTKLLSLREELDKIHEIETRGAILRAKAMWAEAGEKNTKYFLNLEKRNSIEKHITQLELSDGTATRDPSVILSEQKTFYQRLYSDVVDVDSPVLSDIFNNKISDNKIVSMSDVEKSICEGLLTVEECTSALKEMMNGKSPGTSGFTTEFYTIFWSDVKDVVTYSLNYAFKNGELSIDQKRGIITLLPKKGKI
jgi:exonuclease III